LKVGQTFKGIVLSSEATVYVSPADRSLVETHGISGINCSWNRLNEIPFDSMGKGRNQRRLPFLYAANSVNYGRPHKLNTAEAMAACLFLTGFRDEAAQLLEPFGYGVEFLRLNADSLCLYGLCGSSEEIIAVQERLQKEGEERQRDRETRKERGREGCKISASYLDGMDLPPSGSDGEYEYGGEGEEEEADGI
jgi:pre-rRNA-processing protein TSR3